ncbi:MAG TPA: alkaline phosphatase PhoX, partial [Polyangiaceae bacterium]|nr:alkaline phosphatase PhoX [Polyangiaceae bacterium]
VITPTTTPSTSSEFGRISDPNGRHARDFYGYLVEMDPGKPAGEYEGAVAAGDGHKKLGVMGRARWENTTFAVDGSWKLVANKPIVMYAGDDRRGGRIYKWVSAQSYQTGMTKAQVRALLDDGKLYVAHFAGLDNTTGKTMLATSQPPTETQPGNGSWIELSLSSTAVAPNATALSLPGATVGQALQSLTYNGIGGFANDDAVRRSLFTASNKIGIMELNRPEDVEYNPNDPSGTPRLYVAFTNHTQRVALDQEGKLFDPAQHATLSPLRADTVGAIFAMEEATPSDPATSTGFSFFQVWNGTSGDGPWDAACPDNILIDHDGAVWFGTDGNFGVNGHADAVYFLDLDPAHAQGQMGVVEPTYGRAFRILSTPSDAEVTGPAFTSDMRTMFVSVQHPGEEQYSAWPHGGAPLPAVVAVTMGE